MLFQLMMIRSFLKVNIYTINKKKDMIKFIKKEINGIFTDYPDILSQTLNDINSINKIGIIKKIENILKTKIKKIN